MKYTPRLLFKMAFTMAFFFIFNGKAQTALKVNAPFLPLGMLGIAAEQPLSTHYSLQAEVFVSPWKSFAGKNLQIYMGTLEGRYYFGEAMKRWYVGTYLSVAAFNLQKWNYWNDVAVVEESGDVAVLPDGTERITEVYQKGFTFIAGVSGGYHFTVNEKLGLDLFVGIGTSQSFYKGYYKDNNERYDNAEKWNKSGEVIPTRGGLMVTYTFH